MALEEEVQAIAEEVEADRQPTELLIGIDGPSGSGKSTLARDLAARLEALIVEGDDFYRPASERLTTTGVGEAYDWRRLKAQVLDPLRAGQPGRYQRYDWGSDEMADWHDVPTGKPTIVEGIYTLRAELRPCFDYSVWVEAPEEQRLQRGLARDGAGARQQWDEWMALEDEYVRTQRPDQHANRRVSGAAISS